MERARGPLRSRRLRRVDSGHRIHFLYIFSVVLRTRRPMQGLRAVFDAPHPRARCTHPPRSIPAVVQKLPFPIEKNLLRLGRCSILPKSVLNPICRIQWLIASSGASFARGAATPDVVVDARAETSRCVVSRSGFFFRSSVCSPDSSARKSFVDGSRRLRPRHDAATRRPRRKHSSLDAPPPPRGRPTPPCAPRRRRHASSTAPRARRRRRRRVSSRVSTITQSSRSPTRDAVDPAPRPRRRALVNAARARISSPRRRPRARRRREAASRHPRPRRPPPPSRARPVTSRSRPRGSRGRF